LGLRVTPDLKRALDDAAERSGRSQSQEAEFRIERSFAEERSMIEALELAYGSELAFMVQAVAEAMKEAGRSVGFMETRTLEGSRKWWDHPYAFSQAAQAAVAVLVGVKPAGDPSVPASVAALNNADSERFQPIDFANLGHGFAHTILEEAGSGHTRSSGNVARARRLHRSAGPLSQRLRKFCSEEFLNAASHLADEP
jgi:hypothetical protein